MSSGDSVWSPAQTEAGGRAEAQTLSFTTTDPSPSSSARHTAAAAGGQIHSSIPPTITSTSPTAASPRGRLVGFSPSTSPSGTPGGISTRERSRTTATLLTTTTTATTVSATATRPSSSSVLRPPTSPQQQLSMTAQQQQRQASSSSSSSRPSGKGNRSGGGLSASFPSTRSKSPSDVHNTSMVAGSTSMTGRFRSSVAPSSTVGDLLDGDWEESRSLSGSSVLDLMQKSAQLPPSAGGPQTTRSSTVTRSSHALNRMGSQHQNNITNKKRGGGGSSSTREVVNFFPSVCSSFHGSVLQPMVTFPLCEVTLMKDNSSVPLPPAASTDPNATTPSAQPAPTTHHETPHGADTAAKADRDPVALPAHACFTNTTSSAHAPPMHQQQQQQSPPTTEPNSHPPERKFTRPRLHATATTMSTSSSSSPPRSVPAPTFVGAQLSPMSSYGSPLCGANGSFVTILATTTTTTTSTNMQPTVEGGGPVSSAGGGGDTEAAGTGPSNSGGAFSSLQADDPQHSFLVAVNVIPPPSIVCAPPPNTMTSSSPHPRNAASCSGVVGPSSLGLRPQPPTVQPAGQRSPHAVIEGAGEPCASPQPAPVVQHASPPLPRPAAAAATTGTGLPPGQQRTTPLRFVGVSTTTAPSASLPLDASTMDAHELSFGRAVGSFPVFTPQRTPGPSPPRCLQVAPPSSSSTSQHNLHHSMRSFSSGRGADMEQPMLSARSGMGMLLVGSSAAKPAADGSVRLGGSTSRLFTVVVSDVRQELMDYQLNQSRNGFLEDRSSGGGGGGSGSSSSPGNTSATPRGPISHSSLSRSGGMAPSHQHGDTTSAMSSTTTDPNERSGRVHSSSVSYPQPAKRKILFYSEDLEEKYENK